VEKIVESLIQGHGSPHAEPFRESEPLPDDTDDPEVERAFRCDDAGERGDEEAADD
jgi:hypothetical protein